MLFGLFKNKKENKKPIRRHSNFGFLGKVKHLPEFLKFNIDSREALDLYRWVQDGYSELSRNAHVSEKKDDSSSLFFWAGNEEQASVCGLLRASCDSAGRNYPFVTFALGGIRHINKNPSGLFLRDDGLLNSVRQYSEDIFGAENHAEMERCAQKLESVADSLNMGGQSHFQKLEEFRQFDMNQFWRQIGLQSETLKESFVHYSILKLKEMRDRRSNKNTSGLRFPMPLDSEMQTKIGGFWLLLFTTLLSEENWRPCFFLNFGNEDNPPCLTLFSRPINASYFRCIWDSQHETINVVDIMKECQKISEYEEHLDWVQEGNISMLDGLRNWCQVS